jgi:hypothetical protein
VRCEQSNADLKLYNETQRITEMEITLKYQEEKKSSRITIGDIIRSKVFDYGIAYPKKHKEIFVG